MTSSSLDGAMMMSFYSKIDMEFIYYSGFDESQFNFELHDVHREQVCKVIVPLRLNYALCLLKDDYRPLRAPLPAREDRCKEAVEQCNEVLACSRTRRLSCSCSRQIVSRRFIAALSRGLKRTRTRCRSGT